MLLQDTLNNIHTQVNSVWEQTVTNAPDAYYFNLNKMHFEEGPRKVLNDLSILDWDDFADIRNSFK